MAQYHFVEDYQRLVEHFLAIYPLDEAMSRAVGGDYERVGAIEKDILLHYGLKPGDRIIDLGCGSGRLAHALGKTLSIEYIGLDIVQQLLDYAARKSPAHYTFLLNRSLTLPLSDTTANFCTAFSVFTHLLPAESYLYLQEMKRILVPDGKIIFSFLEFSDPSMWEAFANEVDNRKHGHGCHLNMFLERNAIEAWCQKLDLKVLEFVSAQGSPKGTRPLGQTLAVLQKI